MLANTNTTMTVDQTTFTITFHRRLTAPRERVFDAWTTPEHVQHWWDPSGARLAECTIDLRPGGEFKFTNQGHHHSPPFAGTYRLVERPSRLVFDALGALGTVSLETSNGGTQMTVSIQCSSAEHLAHFIQLGVADGTGKTLDNLVTYLA